ncbi:MAG: DUF1848 domain-containing protein [Methanosarcinaceae archaeon]|nr:DUF1848 domain-containing protein [Methanosarcinaceae archaeon]
MIINTGARTDTVQYYTPWLLKRFEEGYVLSRNPLFPDKVTRYELTPETVDCVEFCSKNYRPVLKDLHRITDRFHTHFQYTITAYGKDIEPGVPSVDESIRTLFELEKIVGAKRIFWRYDPVLLTDRYTIQVHLETFDYIASRLAGHVDRCVFSFIEMYRKLEKNMPELIPMTDSDKEALAKGLGEIAAKHGIYIQTCGSDIDYSRYGIHSSGCITAEILGSANGIMFRRRKHNGMRKGCHCLESRDIGAYDTCPNGCRYCYANKDPQTAAENYRRHDPDSPLLLGRLKETDIIQQGVQTSWLEKKIAQGQQTLDFRKLTENICDGSKDHKKVF